MTVTGKSKTKIRAFTDQGTEENISQIINGEYNSIPLNDMKNWSKWASIISRKSGQKIQKIANLQYYKSKANYGTKKKGISRKV